MLSEKQEKFLTNDLRRINLLYGSVRSGKTWISLLKWAWWVGNQPANQAFLMVGKTITTLKRNCLSLLESLIGDNITYSLGQKKAIIFGRTVWLEGANDERSESKIRGMTLKGVYIDELTQIPHDFYLMALSRLSEKGAALLATTNPDHPKHYVKTEIIDNDKIDKQVIKFLIDDNIFLDEEYKENLKKEYSGVYYDRFICGEFVRADGLIYRLIAEKPERYIVKKEDLPSMHTFTIGEDFGKSTSGHAITLSAIGSDGHLYFLKSIFKESKGNLVEDIVNWSVEVFEKYYEEYPYFFDVYPDSAESSLINSIRAKSRFNIYPSIKHEIIDRIRVMNRLLATEKVHFVEGECDILIAAFSEALWDEKSLIDKRLDDGTTNIDSIDSAEYSAFSYNLHYFEDL